MPRSQPPGRPAGTPPAAPSPASKRSPTVSLVLLVGAATAAWALARVDPSQKEEDALIYPTDEACIADARRSPEECRDADRAAREVYPRVAPRYATNDACERHHGAGACTAGGSVSPEAAGTFIPALAGYMIGRTAAQALPVQPLFRHQPEEREAEGGSGGGGRGYCTGSGGRVWASRGGTGATARVASSTARSVPTGAQVVARGGLGGAGRAVAAASHSGGSGGGHAASGG